MTKWEYRILSTWWTESGRSDAGYGSSIQYRHEWQPGHEVEEFASGMTANLGEDGWELVTITTASITLATKTTPQNDSYGSFPTHKLFFKRPKDAS